MADFNSNIDKITERELVPDIYERVIIGEDLKDLDNKDLDNIYKTFFKAGTHLNTIDSKIIASLPTSLSNNIENIHTKYINIDTEHTSYTVTLEAPSTDTDNGTKMVLLRAYLERTLVDIRSLMNTDEPITNTRSVTYNIDFDTPFKNTDILKIHYYFREE